MSEQNLDKKRRFLPVVVVGVILAALCGISLYLRITLPYHQIFVGDAVWFRETDAYYYIRNIETLIREFPHINLFDPYMLYPGGGGGPPRPFFAWLVAAVILLAKGGAATLHSVEVVAAYVPPILGTLVLIPVYFIGKELFNRWVGVIAAALIVFIPSELLHRSMLGFTDHHVAEVLLSTVSVLFLIMAIKRARERDISFTHILNRDWVRIRKPLIYALLAGVFLGLYLLSWQGGLLFVFVIFACLVIQFIVDHLRRRSTDYLCMIGTPLFLVSLLMLLPILIKGAVDPISLIALPVAIVVPIALSIISRLMASRALKPVYYVWALLGVTGIGLVFFYAINPALLKSILGQFSIFTPGGAMLTVMEVSPLLFPYGKFSFAMAAANFNASFFISLVSIVMLIYVAIKGKGADKILFLVWSIIMLLAVLGQRRFGYYYTVSAALLTGYFCWKMLDISGLNKLLVKSKEAVKALKKFKKKGKKSREQAKAGGFMQPRGAWVSVIVVGIVLFAIVFLPSIPSAKALAGSPNMIMDAGWYNSLVWLRDNSPEPFGDPDFYYGRYPPRDEFEYPDTAYAVMSWWDYGYFIMQIGHRVPNANPGQAQAAEVGKFFTAQNQSAARAIMEEYNLGTKYVMIDSLMATSKFYAMAQWAGKSEDEFYGVYYVPTQEGGRWSMLYYPAYYESMVARLYNFDGKNVTPTQPVVISYEEKEYQGQKYKEVTGGQPFPTYEEAQSYVANQTAGNYRIIGADPFSSIVPLEELGSYKRVYPTNTTVPNGGTTVKIFEYLGSDES